MDVRTFGGSSRLLRDMRVTSIYPTIRSRVREKMSSVSVDCGCARRALIPMTCWGKGSKSGILLVVVVELWNGDEYIVSCFRSTTLVGSFEVTYMRPATTSSRLIMDWTDWSTKLQNMCSGYAVNRLMLSYTSHHFGISNNMMVLVNFVPSGLSQFSIS